MRHARPDDLETIAPLLVELRSFDGLVERTPGSFYRKGRGFLHFHVDPTGLFADLKVDGEFERTRVTTRREQRTFLATVRREAS